MTETLCVVCGRPNRADTAWVCPADSRRLQRELRQAAGLAGELETTVARQGRSGQQGGRGGASRPLPYDREASDAAWVIGNTITTWVRHCSETRGVPQPDPIVVEHPTAWAARWLASQLEWLRHRPEAQQAWDELTYACRLLVRTIDRHGVRWYAGPCNAATDAGKCLSDLYAAPGAQVVRCRDCGTEHDAQRRLEWLLDEAQDSLLHAEWMAQVLSKWGVGGDQGVTSARVRGLARHGRIAAHTTDAAGRPVYRLGDVLEAIHDQETREQERWARLEARRTKGAAA